LGFQEIAMSDHTAKMNTFLTIMQCDIPFIKNLEDPKIIRYKILSPKFLVCPIFQNKLLREFFRIACVCRYIIMGTKRWLYQWQLDALLLMIAHLNYMDPQFVSPVLQKIGESLNSFTEVIHLGSLFNVLLHHTIYLNQICGFPLNEITYRNCFDGKILQQTHEFMRKNSQLNLRSASLEIFGKECEEIMLIKKAVISNVNVLEAFQAPKVIKVYNGSEKSKNIQQGFSLLAMDNSE
jgi:hypothetical protein